MAKKSLEGNFENPVFVSNFRELKQVPPGQFVKIKRKYKSPGLSIFRDSVELVYVESDLDAIGPPASSIASLDTLSLDGNFVLKSHYEPQMPIFEPSFEIKYNKFLGSHYNKYLKVIEEVKKQNA